MHKIQPDSNKYIISFESDRLKYGKVELDNSLKSGIYKGISAIVGKNGSGKSTLATIIEKGRYAYANTLGFSTNVTRVKMLTFTDIHAFTGIDVNYYQQRLEATANDFVPTVKDIFLQKLDTDEWRKFSEAFHLNSIIDKKINYLSSGELRKLLIINALCEKPDFLILDNPYIGLDVDARAEFDEAMLQMRLNDVSIIFLLCDFDDVPDYVDSLIELKDRKIGLPITDKTEIANFLKKRKKNPTDFEFVLPDRTSLTSNPDCETVFSITDGHARYGDKIVFENFNWTIKQGECWALTGPNGSGKSLLLSMICADNPQGYSNNIILFDRKRGSGESIWEIKDGIGYICPEMQLYFKSNDSVREIIIQGMRNSLNRYKKSTVEEAHIADQWMTALDIQELAGRKFHELSSGEQRIVLLARALIKQPELLVLDEPLHGLDKDHKIRVKKIISHMIDKNKSSLIFVTHYSSELPGCITHFKIITHVEK